MVLEPELTFNGQGDLTGGPMAKFLNLPEDPIFTMHYHIPDNWLIEPVKSIYDLDNIKLANVDQGSVHSEFELEYLLLEGHCFEAYTGNPPRGLQLTLGTKNQPVVMDTIVMANLGYLQLKSSPGRWLMRLRDLLFLTEDEIRMKSFCAMCGMNHECVTCSSSCSPCG